MPFSSLIAPHGISLRDRFCSCMGKRPPRTTSPATRRASPEVATVAVEPAEDADEDVGGSRRRNRQERRTTQTKPAVGGGIAVVVAVLTLG